MRRFLALTAFVAATASAQQPFTLQQVLSAPYALSLTASPVGAEFAWVENAEGRRNIWIGGPHEPARQLTHYTEDDAQDIASVTWSPDGSTVAYVYGAETGASGKPANPDEMHGQPLHIILQPLAPGAPTQDIGEGHAPLFMHGGCGIFFLRGGKIWARGFRPQPKRSSTAVREDPHAPEPNLLCDTAEQGNYQLVTDRGSAGSLALSPDGNVLAYISHRGTHSLLALFDVNALVLKFPAPSTGDDSAPIFSRDGKQLAWLRFPFTDAPEFAGNRTSPNSWSIQLATLDTHAVHVTTRTLFQPEANKPGSAEPRISTGEPHLYFTADNHVLFFSEADGWVHLYAIDPDHQQPPTLLTPATFVEGGEVEDAVVSRDGKTLFYASIGPIDTCRARRCTRRFRIPENSDIRTVWKVDLTATTPSPAPLTPSNVIATHPVELSDGTVAGLVSDAQEPMHPAILSSFPAPLSSLDNARPPVAIMSTRLPSDYPRGRLVYPRQIIFSSTDPNTLKIHAQLFLPAGIENLKAPGKHPAILFFHGGPKRQMLLGYPAMDYYSNAYAMNQYLASRGYIVLSVNYRGGIGYGLDFRQCQHCGADGAAEYNDVLAAVAYLRSRPDVDAAHIGIWGGSYGGYLTALALARNSDLFAAGVDFHGVHEWAREDNATTDWLRGPLADQEKIAALAHASSPMADVDKWRSPVLLIHGDDDPEVAYTQTPMLADALRARNVHVEELIFPDELHGFLLHRDWLAAYEAAANFFDRTLKPAP